MHFWLVVTQIAVFYKEYANLLRKMPSHRPFLELLVMNLQDLFSTLFLFYYILIWCLRILWYLNMISQYSCELKLLIVTSKVHEGKTFYVVLKLKTIFDGERKLFFRLQSLELVDMLVLEWEKLNWKPWICCVALEKSYLYSYMYSFSYLVSLLIL